VSTVRPDRRIFLRPPPNPCQKYRRPATGQTHHGDGFFICRPLSRKAPEGGEGGIRSGGKRLCGKHRRNQRRWAVVGMRAERKGRNGRTANPIRISVGRGPGWAEELTGF
jgi:hypothetical protein